MWPIIPASQEKVQHGAPGWLTIHDGLKTDNARYGRAIYHTLHSLTQVVSAAHEDIVWSSIRRYLIQRNEVRDFDNPPDQGSVVAGRLRA